MTDLIVGNANFVWEFFYCFQSMHEHFNNRECKKNIVELPYFDILFLYNNTPLNNNSFIAYSQNRKSNNFLLISIF